MMIGDIKGKDNILIKMNEKNKRIILSQMIEMIYEVIGKIGKIIRNGIKMNGLKEIGKRMVTSG